jgi:hypothetical protein
MGRGPSNLNLLPLSPSSFANGVRCTPLPHCCVAPQCTPLASPVPLPPPPFSMHAKSRGGAPPLCTVANCGLSSCPPLPFLCMPFAPPCLCMQTGHVKGGGAQARSVPLHATPQFPLAPTHMQTGQESAGLAPPPLTPTLFMQWGQHGKGHPLTYATTTLFMHQDGRGPYRWGTTHTAPSLPPPPPGFLQNPGGDTTGRRAQLGGVHSWEA